MRIKLQLLLATLVVLTACQKDESAELIAPYFFDSDCEVVAPEEANGLSTDCYLPILEERFSDNNNGWNIGDGAEYNQEIDDGALMVSTEQNSNSTWGTSKVIDGLIDFDQFEIEVDFKIKNVESGSENEYNVIIWGSNDDLDDYHAFSYNSNNEIVFYKRNNGGTTEFYSGSLQSGSFSSNAYSNLIIRKYDGFYYFFLNGDLITAMPFQNTFGDKLFVGANSGNEVWIDEFNLYSLF